MRSKKHSCNVYVSVDLLLPNMLPVDQSEEAQIDHVPRGAVFVLHQIQSHGNMRVTVVAAEVVLRRKRDR